MRLIVSVLVLLGLMGSVAFANGRDTLQSANPQLQGYMSSESDMHNGFVTDVQATCTFPDGLTQVQGSFQIDGSSVIYPNCAN